MRSGEIEIATRGRQNCFLLLRAETVASCFRQLVSFERFENRVADVGLRCDYRSWRVTLLVDFFDRAFGVLNQVVVPAIRHARRDPREKPLNRALAVGLCFVQPLPGNLNIEIPCAD